MGDRSAEPAWFGVAVEEYKAHRAAILDEYRAAQHTLTFGGATVGVLVAGGFNVWKEDLPAILLFLVVIPLVGVLVVVQWCGQMLSIGQHSRYLETIEYELRSVHPSMPVSLFRWEEGFRSRLRIAERWWLPDLRWHENAATVVFGLIAVGSVVIGASRGVEPYGTLVVFVAGAEVVLLALTGVAMLWEVSSAHRRPSVSALRAEAAKEVRSGA